MTMLRWRIRGAWCALAFGLWGCADPGPAGSLEVTPTALRLTHAESARLRLTWTPSRRLVENTAMPTVFVHLVHPTAKTVRTFDHRFPGSWEPGTPVTYDIDIAESALAEPLPEGTYRLAVGLYDRPSYRWPLVAGGEDLDRRITPPGVAPPGAGLGRVAAVEAGGKQTVASRWLQAGGTVRTYAAGGAAQLRFQLGGLPENAAGVAATSVAIDGDCLLTPATVEGSGAVEVSLPLRGGSQDESCSIRLLPQAGGAGAWARLDGIDWRPPAG
jgi:hypothetical protein